MSPSLQHLSPRRVGVLLASALAFAILAAASPALALDTAVWSAALPASGAAVLAKPSWIAVTATDSSPVLSATMRINGLPAAVSIDRPVGHFAYDEDQESYVWVADDLRVARLMSYSPGNRLVPGLNTVVATVAGAAGTSTYSWTFNYGSATTLSSMSPTSGAVLAASPPTVSVVLASPGSSFTSTTTLDGAVVPTVYAAGTKTFTHTPGTALSPGSHTVAFTARDAGGGTVSKTWSFTVRPPMSTGGECTTCHTTYPAAHPFSGCADCHTHGYTVAGGSHGAATPTAAGCGGDGLQQASACHRLDHASDSVWGIWGSGPFTCTTCHSATYPAVPRHTDASTTAVHVSASTGCGPCHSTSLVAEHAKYPTAASIKYQCDLCHGPGARAQVKDAVAAKHTSCDACHDAASAHGDLPGIHDASAASSTVTILGASLGSHKCSECHAATLTVHDNDCATCHPGPRNTFATWNRTCTDGGCHSSGTSRPHLNVDTKHVVSTTFSCTSEAGCHSGSGNLAAIHGSDGCADCHGEGKNPGFDCYSCHDFAKPHGDLNAVHSTASSSGSVQVMTDHVGVPSATMNVDCTGCHRAGGTSGNLNLLLNHPGGWNNCRICHFGGPRETFTTWNKSCQQGACHATTHTPANAAHQAIVASNDGSDAVCTKCHRNSDWEATQGRCASCHTPVSQQPPAGERPWTTDTFENPPQFGGLVATLTLSARDQDGSGIRDTFYRIDEDAWRAGTPPTTTIAFTVDGTHTVSFYSISNADAVEASKTREYFVDANPPTTSSNAVATYRGSAAIKLTASDGGGSGVRYLIYQLDNQGWVATTTVSVDISTGVVGDHTLRFYSEDNASHNESVHVVTFSVIDGTAPTTTSSIVTGSVIGPIAQTIFLSSVDNPGGSVAKIYYRIDAGAWNSMNGAFGYIGAPYSAIPTTRTLQFYGVDSVGNTETVRTSPTFMVDWETPTTSSDALSTYWGPATIHLSAGDGTGSGVRATYYRLDGWLTTYTGTTISFAAPASGYVDHPIKYWSQDWAGNAESPMKALTVRVYAAP